MSDNFRIRFKSKKVNFKFEENIITEFSGDASDLNAETEQEVAAKFVQAQLDEKYDEGYQQGYDTAKAELENKFADSFAEKTNEFNFIISKIDSKLSVYEYIFNRLVLETAFELSEKIVKREIERESITVDTLKDALKKIIGANQIIVKINPADYESVITESRQFSALDSYDKIKFEKDGRVEKGGCIVETDLGNIDARISSQFAELRSQVDMKLFGDKNI